MTNYYPYITAWGKFLGSTQQHVEHQITLALGSNAPQDAVYRNADGTWKRYQQLTPLTQSLLDKNKVAPQ